MLLRSIVTLNPVSVGEILCISKLENGPLNKRKGSTAERRKP
jgi:hypothetical protein